jgi:hypothetical protein
VRHDLRYGLVAPILEDIVSMRFVADFGYLRTDQVLRFQIGGNEHARAFPPVTPVGAEVLAVDDYGRPCLLRNRVGDGWAVLCSRCWSASTTAPWRSRCSAGRPPRRGRTDGCGCPTGYSLGP